MKQVELAFRLFRLACDTRPQLPNKELLNILAPNIRDLIVSGAKNGFNTHHANYAQLETIYNTGASGRESTQEEFKELLCQAIFEGLLELDTMDTRKRTSLFGQLDAYSKLASVIPQARRAWDAPAPEFPSFKTQFAPLDRALQDKCYGGVITVISLPGDGKSYFSLALGEVWDGPVWYYEPENGEGVTLTRAKDLEKKNCEGKEFIFGSYDPGQIVEESRASPDKRRLIIFDSLHFVCGTGRDPRSGALYERAYESAIQLAQDNALILITTQIKRGADGDSIDAGAASACIERHSSALIHLKKGILRPDLLQTYRLYLTKNRTGAGGIELEYAFNYAKARAEYIVGDEHDYKPDVSEFEEWE